MTYPTDVHQEDAWPSGWGELTPVSSLYPKVNSRILCFSLECGSSTRSGSYWGRATWTRLAHFSTRTTTQKRFGSLITLFVMVFIFQVYIRSTDVNRTLISAYSNIAGMFASGRRGRDYPKFGRWPAHWTPVPVHTIELDTDHVSKKWRGLTDNKRNRLKEVETEKDSQTDWLRNILKTECKTGRDRGRYDTLHNTDNFDKWSTKDIHIHNGYKNWNVKFETLN